MFSKYVDSVGFCIGTIIYLLTASWLMIKTNLIGLSSTIYFEDISIQMLFMIAFLSISMITISLVSTFMNKLNMFMFNKHKGVLTIFALLLSSIPLNIFMLMTLSQYQNIYTNVLIIGIYISIINSTLAYLLVRSSVGICWNINYGLNKMLLVMKK